MKHERIWLQWDGDEDLDKSVGQTWCQDQISDTDIEYVLAEKVAALVEAGDKLERIAENAQYAIQYEDFLSESEKADIDAWQKAKEQV